MLKQTLGLVASVQRSSRQRRLQDKERPAMTLLDFAKPPTCPVSLVQDKILDLLGPLALLLDRLSQVVFVSPRKSGLLESMALDGWHRGP